jgi:hypothetical protein
LQEFAKLLMTMAANRITLLIRRRYVLRGRSPFSQRPGHDPLVMQIYPPAKPELKDIAVRLDVSPRERSR